MTHPAPIAKVVAWTFHPEPRNAIIDLLKALTDDQLQILMTQFPGAAGTLGWLEFGHRQGFIPRLTFDIVEVRGEIQVKTSLPAPVIVENITLEHKWEDGGD